MIASVVFATVLLLAMVGVTRIGRMYYKGISQSRAQEAARRLSDDIVSQLQFGKGDIEPVSIPSTTRNGGESEIFCIGEYRYKLTYNRQLNSTNPEVFIREVKNGASCELDESVDPFDNEKTELLPKDMRITKFNITPNGAQDDQRWVVDIKIVFGDEDLLEYPAGAGSNDLPAKYEAAICKGQIAGGEFCAASQLTTTVLRRLSS